VYSIHYSIECVADELNLSDDELTHYLTDKIIPIGEDECQTGGIIFLEDGTFREFNDQRGSYYTGVYEIVTWWTGGGVHHTVSLTYDNTINEHIRFVSDLDLSFPIAVDGIIEEYTTSGEITVFEGNLEMESLRRRSGGSNIATGRTNIVINYIDGEYNSQFPVGRIELVRICQGACVISLEN